MNKFTIKPLSKDSDWINMLYESTGIEKKKLSVFWKKFKLNNLNNFSDFLEITEKLKIKTKKEEKIVEFSNSNKMLIEFWWIIGPKGNHAVHMKSID